MNEKMARLESLGFERTGEPCPECGGSLYEREKLIWIDESDDQVIEIEEHCASCNYSDLYYDA